MAGLGKLIARLNPFALIVVRNTDADEAGDYRIVRRWHLWFGQRPHFEIIPNLRPADLD